VIYSPKRDWWAWCIHLPLFLGAIGIALHRAMTDPSRWVLSRGPLALTCGLFLLWGFCRTSYEITGLELIVRVGLLRQRIDLDRIVEVFPVRRFFGGFAVWSSDRLQVNFRKESGKIGFRWISPRDKAGFCRERVRAVPAMRVVGNRVVRLPKDELMS